VRRKLQKSQPVAIAVAALLIAGCRGAGGASSSPVLPVTYLQRAQTTIIPDKTKHKIQHIVVLIQENRTVENLFYGYPGAMTVKDGYGSKGQKIQIKPVPLAENWDLEHNANSFFASCNGTGKIPGTKCRMNGFDKIIWYCGHGGGEPKCPIKYPPYGYVPHSEILPYFDMANQYVLAAQMYASDFELSSFTSHQYIIAAVNPNSSVGAPTKQWGCPGGPKDRIDKLLDNRAIKVNALIPCWTPATLAQELDAKHISWAYYASPVSATGGKPCGKNGPDHGQGRKGIWSAYQAIKYVCYGPDWDKHVIAPPSQFLRDVKGGNLRAVTWVTPRYSDSDHPGNGSDTGPSWVTSVVNAIGKSPFWSSTAIFIFWDDPGGWYDPAPPAYVDNDGLGFRLPMLIVSPYAKQGWVSQVHYEHGSILRFIEDRYGLKPLAASDTRATSPAKDCFDFSKPPRKFVPIKAKYPESFFLNALPDDQPPDTD
jgi:phospholipase C